MSKIRRFGKWLARNPVVGDALLALVALFFACISTTTDEGGLWIGYSGGWQILWSCALIVPLLFRRTHPQGAALVFASLAVAQLLAGPSYVFGDLLAAVMLYSVIVYGNPARSKVFITLAFIIGIAAAPIITWGSEVGPLYNPGHAGDSASWTYYSCHTVYTSGFTPSCGVNFIGTVLFLLVCIVTVLITSCFMGYRSRIRLATASLLRERNEALATREQEDLDIARTAERARIARDMHDVVAHTLSTIIVQSDGGRYAGAKDPTKAREIMETIRHESQRAQHDMDGLLSTFGGTSHAGYDDIAGLVAQADATARAANGNVTHTIGGNDRPQPERLSDKAQSALYHAVQETLTNARKYAGKGVTVEVEETWSDNGLHLTVRDNGNGAAASLDGHRPGYGITGMRERIEAVGGSIQAGSRVGGGFEVDVDLPFAGTSQASSETASPSKAASSTDTTQPSQTRSLSQAAPTLQTDSSSQTVSPSPAKPLSQAISQPQAEPLSQTAGSAQINHESANSDSTERKSAGRISTEAVNSSIYSKLLNYGLANDEPNNTTPITRNAKPYEVQDIKANEQLPNSIKAHHRFCRRNLPAQANSSTAKPATQQATARLNWAERLSEFFARHYVLADTIIAFALMAIIFSWSVLTFQYYEGSHDMILGTSAHASTLSLNIADITVSLVVFATLAFRRRFPQTAAAVMVIAATFSLCFLEEIPSAVLYAPVSLYSVCLYGKNHSRRWASVAAIVDSVLFGLRFSGSFVGYPTLVDWVLNRQQYSEVYGTRGSYPYQIIGLIFLALSVCAVAIGAALWVRASGTNAMVLEARHEAMEEESAKKQVLAANNERERIGAQIRGEVSETLSGVIDKADAGLAMLDADAAADITTSPQAITAAFHAIGEQGREALAHMRELLRVLRETGGSDDSPTASQPLLHPVTGMKSKED
ncbi:histidine kinase [Bifidobacterium sp. ESL0784]|uniref:sensor histidine kinase n=1 Tax=Bifidobacterium sp. ESL0784 TaxID=2983231 RepID=UPI0023F8DB73|nr:histidine kinase [Bifidobacterium sp. ESL0784]MDF7641404.1 histidine kinase [Bifidobacterium sp. ESL0784]